MVAAGPWTNHCGGGEPAFWLAKPRSPAQSWLGVRQPQLYPDRSETCFQSERKGSVTGTRATTGITPPISLNSLYPANPAHQLAPCLCPKEASINISFLEKKKKHPLESTNEHRRKAMQRQNTMEALLKRDLFSIRYPPKKMPSQENDIVKIK